MGRTISSLTERTVYSITYFDCNLILIVLIGSFALIQLHKRLIPSHAVRNFAESLSSRGLEREKGTNVLAVRKIIARIKHAMLLFVFHLSLTTNIAAVSFHSVPIRITLLCTAPKVFSLHSYFISQKDTRLIIV